jgi:hypothetical protein
MILCTVVSLLYTVPDILWLGCFCWFAGSKSRAKNIEKGLFLLPARSFLGVLTRGLKM